MANVPAGDEQQMHEGEVWRSDVRGVVWLVVRREAEVDWDGWPRPCVYGLTLAGRREGEIICLTSDGRSDVCWTRVS